MWSITRFFRFADQVGDDNRNVEAVRASSDYIEVQDARAGLIARTGAVVDASYIHGSEPMLPLSDRYRELYAMIDALERRVRELEGRGK